MSHPNPLPTARTDVVAVLIRLSKQTRVLLKLHLSEIGLSPGEDDVLLELDSFATVSLDALSSIVRIRTPTLSRTIDRLVAAGLVTVLAGKHVRLTPAGIEKRACIGKLRSDLSAEMVEGMDDERLEKMREQLHRVEASIESKLLRL